MKKLKNLFRKLAHQYHPDKKGGDEKNSKKSPKHTLFYLIRKNASNTINMAGFFPLVVEISNMVGSAGPFGAEGSFNNGFGFEFDPSAFNDFSDLGDIFSAFFEGMGVRQKGALIIAERILKLFRK